MKKYFFILAGVSLLAAGCQQAVKTSSTGNKSNEPKQAVKPQSDQPIPQGEKTGWQTYANSQYKYELKYPNKFIIEGTTASGINLSSDNSCKILKTVGGGEWPVDCQQFNIFVQKDKIGGGGGEVEEALVLIDGLQAEQQKSFDGMYDNMNQIRVQVKKDNNWYIIHYTFNKNKAENAENNLKQILSTFKFQ